MTRPSPALSTNAVRRTGVAPGWLDCSGRTLPRRGSRGAVQRLLCTLRAVVAGLRTRILLLVPFPSCAPAGFGFGRGKVVSR